MGLKNIRLEFEIAVRRYEAISFLKDYEDGVDGNLMLLRTARAVDDKNADFLWRRREQFPMELQPFYLVTNKRKVSNHRKVWCFFHSENKWQQGWSRIDGRWERKAFALVLRRCA